MNHLTVNILDLCDEMLLSIFNKLNNIDVLYSLIDVDKKLDRLARDITFTQSIDLVTISSNEHNFLRNNSILDRFCVDILPRIQHTIECLALDSLSIDRVLHIGNYSKLHKLTLVNLPFQMASRIFNEKSSFIDIFKHQISHLIVMIIEDNIAEHTRKASTDVFTTIFIMFTNLNYLHYGWNGECLGSPRSLVDTLSPTCPSNIVHLNVRVNSFNDCLCLLDGCLSQLHTFIVEVDNINYTSMTINNTKTVSNLKCFSLFSFRRTIEYDSHIVPFIRRMSQLEKLTLSLIVYGRTSFIDGTHLVNDILSKMSHLHTFIFNIITQNVIMAEEFLPAPDDVQRELIQRGYNVNCYTDYNVLNNGQCHIYSLPFIMERMHIHSSKFLGGLFLTVRHLHMRNFVHPFEHDFFARISQAFPLLNKLTIYNISGQKKKLTNLKDEHKQTWSIIEFSHLMTLHLSMSDMDYVEEFLFDFNTRLPCLNTLYIKYKHLVMITENFTKNAARINCSKLEHIIFDSKPTTYPENFYLYFPLL
ncbi:unnamed protein product [Rotaria sordida]|uniref:F-box domain-containing protein n=1 Tax=Rotaria sordida TaxID=392033 RepID=A0A819QXA5_9BILA|nr:unnamed protein product [Rotaria sordida]CAF4037887.1 unnamed protein product [Rotaria sordida]